MDRFTKWSAAALVTAIVCATLGLIVGLFWLLFYIAKYILLFLFLTVITYVALFHTNLLGKVKITKQEKENESDQSGESL